MIDIIVPSTDHELDGVRRLMRAFVSWHMERHSRDIELTNRYFDARITMCRRSCRDG